MPRHELDLHLVFRRLENGLWVAEGLLYPEASRVGGCRAKLAEALRRFARRTVELEDPVDLHMRQLDRQTLQIRRTRLEIKPPPKAIGWREPVRLRFDLVVRAYPGEAVVAYIPELGIEVIARDDEELKKRLGGHLRAELTRRYAGETLRSLAELQQTRRLVLEHTTLTAEVRTPREVAVSVEAWGRRDSARTLEAVARRLDAAALPPAYEIDALVTRLAEVLRAATPRSVLLVGPAGCGKSAAIRELVRRGAALGLGSTEFWQTSGSRLIAGMMGFGDWQKQVREMVEAVRERRAIMHLGSLVELANVGQAEGIDLSVADFLAPMIRRGDFLALAECTPEQLSVIEQLCPRVLAAFRRVDTAEASSAQTIRILRRVATDAAAGDVRAVADGALEHIERLHRRYAPYAAYPGRPIRFLTKLLHERNTGEPVSKARVTQAFAGETGLPPLFLDDSAALDLVPTRRWFEERILGQQPAVELVVDLLATLKAGLTRPRKPIASLLFAGPTGVGKTEMAKALAHFMFSDPGRMTRFDMSEYADPAAVQRLIGGRAGGEGLLTGRVRERPFAVVLFDEFEKAHPLFFDLLLQVLGEGRLTDGGGRVADFCATIVIMTSNLGAETFQRGRMGFGAAGHGAAETGVHFSEAVRAFMRPELFNRIDRVVPFAPLPADVIRWIASQEVERVLRRTGLARRRRRVQVDEAACEHLARVGFHPNYGARPLKRAVERELLVPLARRLNGYADEVPVTVEVGMAGARLEVCVRAEAGGASGAVVPEQACARTALWDIARLRRKTYAFARGNRMLGWENDLWLLERRETRALRRAMRRGAAEDLPVEDVQRLKQLREMTARVKALVEAVADLEADMLSAAYQERRDDLARLAERVAGRRLDWENLAFDIFRQEAPKVGDITLAVFGTKRSFVFHLAASYVSAAQQAGCRLSAAGWFEVVTGRAKDAHPLRFRPVAPAEAAKFLEKPLDAAVGVALGLSGELVLPRFGDEAGAHRQQQRGAEDECLVEVEPKLLRDYVPRASLSRQRSFPEAPVQRVYHLDTGEAHDHGLDEVVPIVGGQFHRPVAELIAKRLQRKIEAAISA